MGITVNMLQSAVESMEASLVVLEPRTNTHGIVVDFIVLYMNAAACNTVRAPKDAEGVSFLQLTGLARHSILFEMFVRVTNTLQLATLHTRLNLVGGGVSDALYDVTCTPCGAALALTWHKSEKAETRSNYTALELFENWENSFSAFELVTHEDGSEDLRLLAANRTFAALISQKYDTLPGKLFNDVCPMALDWLSFYIETAKTGVGSIHESYNYELKKYLCAIQFSPCIGQVALIVVDKTHFWKREQELCGRDKDLVMLFSSMASGFCVGKLVRNAQGTAVDVLLEMTNPAFELLEGFPTATAQGKYLSDLRGNDFNLSRYAQVVQDQGKVTFTKYIPATDVTVESVCFSHGTDRFVCVENNVTDRVKAEADLASSQAELAEKHRIIVSSIDYAGKIQRNLLPQTEDFQRAFTDSAVIWDPRDIVGGDIYWLKNFEEGSVLCVCDCTGHGTPGAFLTMLVVSAFETIVTERNFRDTPNIIWQLEQRLVDVLNVHAGDDVPLCDIKDGCDLAVLSIADDGSVVMSAGNTHVFVCDGHEVMQLKGQKIFVGEGKLKSSADLRAVTLPANPNHKFYIASDGFFDQMGQSAHRPFGYQTFKSIILENHGQLLNVVLQKLWDAFETHRGSELRRDDVQLIAFQK